MPDVGTGAKSVQKQNRRVPSDNPRTVKLYFGIFFDGTSNNNVESMIGQFFRKEAVYKKHKGQLKNLKTKDGKQVSSMEDLAACSRQSLEALKSADGKTGVFTVPELDQLFGAARVTDNRMEKSLVARNSKYRISTIAADNFTGDQQDWRERRLHQMAESQQSGWFQIGQDTSLKTANIASKSANYTNPAILESLYRTGFRKESQGNSEEHHYVYYVEGSGSDTSLSFGQVYEKGKEGAVEVLQGLAGGVGSNGVVEKCKRIAKYVDRAISDHSAQNDVDKIEVTFDVFGFSRGAATARLFAYLVNPKGQYSLSKTDTILFSGSSREFLPLKDDRLKIQQKQVRVLGLFDTVSSIGVLRDDFYRLLGDTLQIKKDNKEFNEGGKSVYHDCNVDDFGLYSTESAESVLHLCAMDECRANFALVDIESSIRRNGTEIFLPGCHTDIGGGGSYGVDSPKIVKSRTTTNKGEILSNIVNRVKGTVEAAQEIKNTLVAAEEVMKGVMDIGVGAFTIAAAPGVAASGLGSVIRGTQRTYEGARKTAYKSNEAAHRIKNIFLDVEEESDTDSGRGEVLDDNAEASANMRKDFDSTMSSLAEFRSSSGSKMESKESFDAKVSVCEMKLEEIQDKIDTASLNQAKTLLEDMRQTWQVILDTSGCVNEILTKKWKPFRVPSKKKKVFFYDTYPFMDRRNQEKLLLDENETALYNMGWIPGDVFFYDDSASAKEIAEETGKTRFAYLFENGSVELYKYSAPGYSNLSLKLMWQWGQTKAGSIFVAFPEDRFPVPSDLNGFYSGLTGKLSSIGRFFCVPDDYDGYRKLREKYLYWSMDQSTTGSVVNGPCYAPYGKDLMVTRRIYVGAKGNETAGHGENKPGTIKYLYQYNGTCTSVSCNLGNDWQQRKQDTPSSKGYQEKNQELKVSGQDTAANSTGQNKTVSRGTYVEFEDNQVQSMASPSSPARTRPQPALNPPASTPGRKPVNTLPARSPQVTGKPAPQASRPRPQPVQKPAPQASRPQPQPAQKPAPQAPPKPAALSNRLQQPTNRTSAPLSNRTQPQAPPKPASLSNRPQQPTNRTSTPLSNRTQQPTNRPITSQNSRPLPQPAPKSSGRPLPQSAQKPSGRPLPQTGQGSGRALPMKPGQAPSSGLLKKK